MLMKVDGNKINGRWTDEFRRAVCELYGVGSATIVAERLGVSKNVVIGIWDRGGKDGMLCRVSRTAQQIGSDGGTAAKLVKAKAPRPRRERPAPAPKLPPAPKVLTPAQIQADKRRARLAAQIICEPVGLLDLKDHHCRSVFGRDAHGIPTYCGARVEPGLSWCAGHAAIVFEAPANLPPSLQLRKIMKVTRNA